MPVISEDIPSQQRHPSHLDPNNLRQATVSLQLELKSTVITHDASGAPAGTAPAERLCTAAGRHNALQSVHHGVDWMLA
jgi:hypothetical protein